MKNFYVAATAVVAVAAVGSADAADLPVKAPGPVLPAWSWTGCYGGVNAGWVDIRNAADLSPGGLYRTATGALPPPNIQGTGDFLVDVLALSHSYVTWNSGWEAGVQVGCNYQMGVVVAGVEADWQWTSAKALADASFAAFPNMGSPFFTNQAHTEHVDLSQKWLATARARLGFTPWERVLVYGTAGVAWADFESNTNVTFATTGSPFAVYNGAIHTGSASTTKFGAVLGGGVEWALTNNWTVKAEYLYLWFDGITYASPLVAAAVPFALGYQWNTAMNEREQIVRVGVNYKFDWSGPIVAKY
jgi:outer membrane immunogenic protein